MSTRFRRLSAAAALAIALTSVPATSLAYPLSSGSTSAASQPVAGSNPLRSLLGLLSQQSAAVWSSLDAVYSSSYVSTANCTWPC